MKTLNKNKTSSIQIPIYLELLDQYTTYEDTVLINQLLYMDRPLSIWDIKNLTLYDKSIRTLRTHLNRLVCRGILTALSLWSIGTQLLDFFILIRTRDVLETVAGAGGGEYSLTTKPIIDSSILDSINMAMSMYWMTPTLSFAVASMNGYAASQMMSGAGATANSAVGGAGAAANSAVGGAAGEIASGSRSMGVVRENMMSANKYDGASSFNSGQSSQ